MAEPPRAVVEEMMEEVSVTMRIEMVMSDVMVCGIRRK